MKVAITGSNGFLGAWTSHLLSLENEVLCLTRPNADTSRLRDNSQLRIRRIPSSDWAKEINDFNPDAVIFFHWEGVLGESRNDVIQMQNKNSHRKLLNAIESDCHLIGVGSQAELGPVAGKILENQPDNPTTKYGYAKISTREVFLDPSVNRGRKVNWVRIFSTYGPTDNPSWLIPSMIQKLHANQDFNMTKGEQEWSYLHALDAAFAFKTILSGKPDRQIINLGNPQTIKLSELARLIANKMDKSNFLKIGTVEYRPDQVMQLAPACETLSELRWRPMIDIEEGLDVVINSITCGDFSIHSFILHRE